MVVLSQSPRLPEAHAAILLPLLPYSRGFRASLALRVPATCYVKGFRQGVITYCFILRGGVARLQLRVNLRKHCFRRPWFLAILQQGLGFRF